MPLELIGDKSIPVFTAGVAVTLSISPAASTYDWALIQYPLVANYTVFRTIALSTTTGASPTFTPSATAGGYYLATCTVNGTNYASPTMVGLALAAA